VLDAEVESALFFGPLRAGDPTATRALAHEIDLLASHAQRSEAIVPGEAFATEIGAQNLMNPAFRRRGVELGLQDGATAASRVRALLG
jgi:hypothetical protein